MGTKNSEFDSLLGGSVELPSNVNLLRFTAARHFEVEHMKKQLVERTGTKLAFQKLPKHMRRRVMSHNVKRLPRRLREVHLNQMKKSGMPPKQKRPCRKYRRRPKNLLEEYSRRRKRCNWLETHIWHAKRFHMVEKWGFKLADRPCDKSFRACYRATANHCLINDISYLGCIEIEGAEAIIVEKIRSVSKPGCGLTVGAKAFIRGNREGEFIMFDSSLKNAIGLIPFNWKPIIDVEELRTLWLWVHPAYFDEVLSLLKTIFAVETGSDSSVFVNNLDKTTIRNKRYDFNRFRLTGPLANAILHNVLRPIDLNRCKEDEWVNKYVCNDEYRQIFAEQLQFWKNIENISSCSELSPRIIISLIISDPRYDLSLVKKKIVPDCADFNDASCLSEMPQHLAFGSIWDDKICKHVKETKISNAAIADMRSKLLVPGSDLGVQGSPIPVLIIQRPGAGNENVGYCSGWDLVLPSGWAQPVWKASIMSGARAGGQRELDSMEFEMSRVSFLSPDSAAGVKEEKRISENQIKRFFSLPPNKRTNYNKFSITSPLSFNWNLLVREWSSSNSPNNDCDFFILRDRTELENLKYILLGRRKQNFNTDLPENCIVPVKMKVIKKGRPSKYSIICVPKQEDLRCKQGPVEPFCEDRNQKKRKEMRDAHQALLKKLRNRRKKAKANGKVIPIDKAALEDYTKEMRELWLPKTEKIRDSCSREVMGFVTKGGFNFRTGGSAAVGYVTLSALKKVLKITKNKVLIRNTNSRQYMFATIDIIV